MNINLLSLRRNGNELCWGATRRGIF